MHDEIKPYKKQFFFQKNHLLLNNENMSTEDHKNHQFFSKTKLVPVG